MRQRSKNRKRTRKIKKKGGEAIAAGGYGCVFKPALVCANNNNNTNHVPNQKKIEMVSKLLLRENAFDEMEEIEKVLSYIQKNPQNSNYFIINDQTSLCTPAPLTSADLQNYNTTCAGTKMATQGITSANINQNLDKVNIITMIDGGIDLEEYWSALVLDQKIKINEKIKVFKKINKTLLGLLNNAIVRLNKDGLYHFDLKGANIMLGKDGHTRLIDWGASFEYSLTTKSSRQIPFKLFNRAIFQYNVPLAVILFTEDLDEVIQNTAKKIKADTKSKEEIVAEIAKDIILYSIKEAGIGHFQEIIEQMVIVYSAVLEYAEFTKEDSVRVIQNYIGTILLKYLDFRTFKFDLFKFFHEVFIHNVDVYGFLISYIDLVVPRLATPTKTIDYIKRMKKTAGTKEYTILIKDISLILHDFCWSGQYAATRIPLSTMTNRLRNL